MQLISYKILLPSCLECLRESLDYNKLYKIHRGFNIKKTKTKQKSNLEIPEQLFWNIF